MSGVKELDMCPVCIKKLQEQIGKAQEEFASFQAKEMEKLKREPCEEEEKAKGGGHEGKTLRYGQLERATPEEIENCLASLDYALPICDFCKAHKNISIVRLPPNAFTVQKAEESPKP